MQATSGVLTSLLIQFNSVFKAAGVGIVSDAVELAGLLVGLELVIAGLYWAASGNEFIPQLVWKIVRIGVFTWIVREWPSLIDTVLSGFIHTGAHAGATIAFKDPSAVLDMANRVLDPINYEIMLLSKGTGALTNLGSILLFDGAWDLTFIAFAILGIQAFITSLEFGILSTVAVILVPFGIFRPMAFLAEKAFGMVVGFGVRMMVLAFIFGAAFPILSTAALPAQPTINQAMFICTGAFAIVFLAWHAPSVAAAMMSGGPSLSAGTVGAAGMAAGLAAVGGVQAARLVAEGGAAMAGQIFAAAKGGGGGGIGGTLAGASPSGGGGGGGSGSAGSGAPDASALRSRMEQTFAATGGSQAASQGAGAAASPASPSGFAGETASTANPGGDWNSRPPSDTPQGPTRSRSNAGSTIQKAIETGMREESPSQGASPDLNGGAA